MAWLGRTAAKKNGQRGSSVNGAQNGRVWRGGHEKDVAAGGRRGLLLGRRAHMESRPPAKR